MNPTPRRLMRLLTGLVAAGIVTTITVAPNWSAQAETATNAQCSTEQGRRDTAHDALRAARAEKRAAVATRAAARTKYDAAPTRRHHRVLRAARAAVIEARAVRVAALSGYLSATTAYDECVGELPDVTVTNPRVAFYGSNFAVADITWSNIPFGEYQYFLRYDDAAQYWGAVTFVDVLPPPAPWDPSDPTPNHIVYLQNTAYPESTLGSGCDYTPGQNVSVELWTSKDSANQPAGTEVASATVDNPCR